MRILGVTVKENPHYCSYDDECWITLAREIMSSYADLYTYQVPTNAFSQEDYTRREHSKYLPIRKSILRKVMNGPLRNVTDIHAVYYGFEQRRLAYKESMGVHWKDAPLDIDEIIGN